MNQYAPCPKCGSTDAKPVGYTMWGGYIGPKLLSHVKCQNCGTAYNGKTGQSNNLAIILYLMAATLVVGCLFFGLAFLYVALGG